MLFKDLFEKSVEDILIELNQKGFKPKISFHSDEISCFWLAEIPFGPGIFDKAFGLDKNSPKSALITARLELVKIGLIKEE
jgi:hypothetical protein